MAVRKEEEKRRKKIALPPTRLSNGKRCLEERLSLLCRRRTLPPARARPYAQRERERERPSEKDSHASSLPFSQQRSALAAQPAADAAARSASGATHSNADEYARFAADPARKHVTWPKLLNASLAEVDPVLVDIIEKEKNRQWKVKEENTRERV